MPSFLRSPRAVPIAAIAVGALLWPFATDTSIHFYGVLSVSYALMALSVMVLAGWTGQISLANAAFLGIGVYATEKLLNAGIPLPLTIPLVAILGAVVSLVLGVPSLRLRGVYLTIVTLAFGAACEKYVFVLESVRGAYAGVVPRASFFGLSTESDRALYFVGLAVLAISVLLVWNIRSSDAGRALFAIRDAEDAAMAMGIRLARYKIGAFAMSAALATLAGVFYALLFRSTPAASQFGVLQSFFLLALPVIGGLGTLAGPIVGGILLATAQPIVNLFGIRLFLATGVGLVLVVLARTDGIVGFAQRVLADFRAASRPPRAAGSFVPALVDAADGHASARVRVVSGEPVGRVRLRLRGATK